MTAGETLEKLLRAYGVYYDVNRNHPAPPFAAEAVFRSHTEQYFLVRRARLAESESNEYVYFALEDVLTAPLLRALDGAAWNAGTARIVPHKDHRNSDVTLLLLASRVEPDAAALIPKLKHYRSYHFGFQGWTHYRLAVVEAETGKVFCNRQARTMRGFLKRNLAL
ncbi:MAG: hypothetical protein IJR54_01860 [Oscillibacter sp.]|nr:hypothetical protein [Oscillibacter sp.]